jgi:dolichol-phosphate mannosyltransferase
MNDILVFTATYNEKENIENLITKISNLSDKISIFVIDDNSPDGTGKILEKIFKNKKNFDFYIREKKLGLNTAHTMAYEYALKNNFNKLITLDADLSHDTNEIPKILELLNRYDFVIGSRYMLGGKNDMKGFRLLLSIYGNKLIKFLLNSKGTEFTSSFRGFNLHNLKNFHLNQIKSRGYSFFMETVIKLEMMGFAIFEIPIYFRDRKYGVSKIPKFEIFRTLKNLILLFFKKK